VTLSLTIEDPDADHVRHLAMLITTAEAARTEALKQAGATGRDRTADMMAAVGHERERDQCARELGMLLAARIDPGPGGPR